MDNFFEIVIWLFVIISFLSSLFKKKKTPEQPKQTYKKPSPYYGEGTSTYKQPQQQTPKQDDYDILKEIEGLFNPDVKTTPGYPKQDEIGRNKTYSEHTSNESNRADSETTSYETGRSLSEYTSMESQRKVTELERRKSETEITSSEHVFTDYSRKKPVVSKEMEEKAKKIENILAEQKKKRNETVRNLRERLRSHNAVRDIVILSEIIGKPKSLS